MQRIALYPGAFDPITFGHLDIVGRAIKLAEKLVIGVAVHSAKTTLFSVEERVEMIRAETAVAFPAAHIEVTALDGLLMHFARRIGAQTIVRGLRAVADFEYEFQMTAMNQQLAREIETVFLMADPRHQAVASRLVKEIARLGGDVSPFVPAGVKSRLIAKFAPLS